LINFSGISANSFFGRALRLPLRLLPPGLRVPILQGPLRGYWWIVGAGNHGYWLGTFESEKQEIFARALSIGHIAYDIGAHAGYYTLLSSARVGPQGHVFAFEPSPRNLQILRKHVAINNRANVTIIGAAVGDQTGMQRFDPGDDSFTGGLYRDRGFEVNVITLDGMFDDGLLLPPDIIKMDIEGGEAAALQGATKLISKAHPLIFLSTHGPQVHAQCSEILKDLGYNLSCIQGRADELIAE
jgi:FkbM family methyltransferase